MEQNNNFTNMSMVEKMEAGEVYDETDLSQINQLNEIEALTKEKRFQPETHPDFDGTHCIMCDEEIEKGRLLLHRIRCSECQTILEKKRR